MIEAYHFILSLSIVFALVIGIVRFKHIDSSYYPLIYNAAIVFIIEILVQLLMQGGHVKVLEVSVNIFSFIDFFLFAWLFHNWRLFNRSRKTFIYIVGGFFIAWFVITFFVSGITTPNLYFRILYSFALIFFSVSTFNKVVVNDRGSIFKNPKFWICLGIIIFYAFFILVCVARYSLFKYHVSRIFRVRLQEINTYSNLLVNLLYAVAILWIPRKKNFTTLF
jgi:hypothetical protein